MSIEKRVTLLASVVVMVLAGSAFAPTAVAAAASGAIETVVVTAERRAVDPQTTAIAVSVLTQEDLKHKGINTLDQLQFSTPSLSVQNFGTGDFINLRGIGQSQFSIQVDSGVVVYFDDIPIGISGFLTDEPYYDMSSVEVLRGPQGTFAGLNATGGAIFERSADPSFDATNGYAEAQYGNYNDARVRGAVNIALSDNAAIRLAVNDERRDSFFHVTGPWTGNPGRLGESNARFGFHWQPTEALDVLLKINYNYVDNGGYPSVPTGTPSNLLFKPALNAHLLGIEHWGRASLKVSYKFDDGTVLRLLSGYTLARNAFDLDVDGTAVAPFVFIDKAWGDVYSEEVNLISPDTGRFQWILGGYYDRQIIAVPPGAFDLTLLSVAPGVTVEDLLVYKEPKSSYAAFGQGTYHITDALTLSVGARFTKSFSRLDDKVSLVTKIALVPPLFLPTFPPQSVVGEHQSDSRVTGKANISWALNADNFLYAFVASGHKAGGINVTAAIPFIFFPPNTATTPAPIFKPEEVLDYEIGWKANFFDDRLRTQIGAFYDDYKNFQISVYDPATQQASSKNAAGITKSDGIEAQAQGVFGDLSFDVGGSYINTKLGKFFAVDPRVPSFTFPASACNPATGPAAAFPGFATCFNLTGKQLPYAPRWTFSLGAAYVFHVLDGDTLTPRLNYGMTGSQWTTPFEFAGDHLSAHNLLNGQIEFAANDWLVTAYATNLADLHYIAAKGIFGPNVVNPGPPRQFGIRVSKTFE